MRKDCLTYRLTLRILFLLVPAGLAAQKQAAPTWNKDIASLIQAHCALCHHKGGTAPFDLLTYEDVAKRTAFIKRVVTQRYMPPWKADPHYVSFSNERILTDKEIRTIADWVDAGAPKGPAVAAPTGAQGAATPIVEGTRLARKPDLVLSLKEPFLVKGDNTERFLVFRIPYELPEEKISRPSNSPRIIIG